MDTVPDISVVIFGLNEAENLMWFIPELRETLNRLPFSAEVVFVDDGSSDGSTAVVRHHLPDARLLRHDSTRGIGASIKSGCTMSSAPWVTFLPADGQLPATIIGQLWHARNDETDIVFSRYDEPHGAWHRSVMSLSIRAMMWTLFGVSVRSDGPYLFKRSLLDADQINADSFFLNFEVPIRARMASLRSTDVTVTPRPRRHGQSRSANFRTIKIVGAEMLAFKRSLLAETLSRWF